LNVLPLIYYHKMSYKGIVHAESLPEGRASATIVVTPLGIKATTTQGQVFEIITDQIQLELGGTSNRKVFLRDKKNTSFSLSTADVHLLKEPIFAKNEDTSKKVQSINTKVSVAKGILVLFGLVCILALASIFVFKGTIIKTLANQIPFSAEKSLGELYIKQLKITDSLDSTSPAAKQLQQQMDLLLKPSGSQTQFTIYISASDQINAFALPGGYLVFNKALLQKANSWEEVLGVGGHEIAHVTLKHHTRGVLSKLGFFTLVSFFLGDGTALTDILFGAGANLEQLSYSRDFETESDTQGFAYLTQANINPVGLKTFFGTLKTEQGEIASAIPEFLSTHPSSDNRINNLEELISKQKNKQYTQFPDYQLFKNKLNK
jgi:beta-barrel assembly-enhancing protease